MSDPNADKAIRGRVARAPADTVSALNDERATLPRNSLFGYHRGRIWEPYGECGLKKHSGRDVHVHAIPAAACYQELASYLLWL
jgi:hypothetical protein